MQLEYSFIIPVFNRPEEIRELLESMLKLDYAGIYEIVLVEDGSSVSSKEIAQEYSENLNISYFFKENSGPGDSRNFGMQRAKGNYFLILDSDVILPSNYLFEVDLFLSKNQNCDCFGGPDAAHASFTELQKAIDYSMTSLFTTGGIRGGKKAVDKFQPRSFNMGLSKKAFEATGGFGKIHPGEDPDLSLRLEKQGFKTCLVPNAKVYHKRRINWSKFYNQVKKFGFVRPILNSWHPTSAKVTYWFPSLFMIGLFLAVVMALAGKLFFISIYFLYLLVIGIDAALKNNNIKIGILAIFGTLVQFMGYGYGFLISTIKINVLKKEPQEAFPFLFFK